jgi:hypothetical protein
MGGDDSSNLRKRSPDDTVAPTDGDSSAIRELIGVAGADATSIDGILPGATKYGQDEYSIERTALGSEFYIESSCGDTEFGGDTVYFRGVIGSK